MRIQACESYEAEAVASAVEGCLEAIPLLRDKLVPGARVLLKPNVINARPPETAICTHPAVVQAVARVCCDAGCEVMIADEPGYALVGEPKLVFEATGMAQACAGLPIRFELLKRGGYRPVRISQPLQVEEALISSLVLDADVVINLPKCKTHQQTLLTGAIKNMFGAVAPRDRIRTHMLGTFSAFGEAVADTFSACVPHISVMDAVVGMEGKGPSRGDPRTIGAVLASEDAVALDAVVESMTGFAPGEVRVTTAAAEKGLGECALDGIEVVGAAVSRFRVALKRPPGGVRRGFPRVIGNLIKGMVWVRPLVDPLICIRCGACAGICPGKAIEVQDFAMIDYDKCIECFCCQEVCPVDAIDTQRSWLARRIIGTGPQGIGRTSDT